MDNPSICSVELEDERFQLRKMVHFVSSWVNNNNKTRTLKKKKHFEFNCYYYQAIINCVSETQFWKLLIYWCWCKSRKLHVVDKKNCSTQQLPGWCTTLVKLSSIKPDLPLLATASHDAISSFPKYLKSIEDSRCDFGPSFEYKSQINNKINCKVGVHMNTSYKWPVQLLTNTN